MYVDLFMFVCVFSWSESVEKALQAIEQRGDGNTGPMSVVLETMESTLNVLADSVLHEQPPVRRKKLEHLVSALECLRLFLILKVIKIMPFIYEID